MSHTSTVVLAYSLMTPCAPGVTSQGTPLVMVHGCFGNRDNFKHQAQSIADQTSRKVYTVDLRNHGDSPRCDHMCFDSMSADLGHLIGDVLGLSRAVVLGHSIGGKVAMVLALQKPDLVEKLVVVDIFPRPMPQRFMPGFKEFMKVISLIQLTGNTLQEVKLNATEELKSVMPDENERELIMQSVTGSKETGFKWKFDIGNLDKNFESINSFADIHNLTYTRETRIVLGAKSDFVREEYHADFKRLFPRMVLVSVEDAGHWVHMDNPEDFVTLVSQFLMGQDNAKY